jgi:hypothetical protein
MTRALDALLNNLRVEPGEGEQRRALTAEPEEDIQFSSVQFRRGRPTLTAPPSQRTVPHFRSPRSTQVGSTEYSLAAGLLNFASGDVWPLTETSALERVQLLGRLTSVARRDTGGAPAMEAVLTTLISIHTSPNPTRFSRVFTLCFMYAVVWGDRVPRRLTVSARSQLQFSRREVLVLLLLRIVVHSTTGACLLQVRR